MTISETSREIDLFGTELPLTPSAAGSRARTQVSPMLAELVQKAREQGSFVKGCELLAKWNANTFSWRTSQNSLIEGLETFSERWPKCGSMQNGIAFQHQISASIMRANGYMSLPTPNARDGKDLSRTVAFLAARERHSPSLATHLQSHGTPWFQVSAHYEMQMGFPLGWSAAVYTDAKTPSSRKSRKSSGARSVNTK